MDGVYAHAAYTPFSYSSAISTARRLVAKLLAGSITLLPCSWHWAIMSR